MASNKSNAASCIQVIKGSESDSVGNRCAQKAWQGILGDFYNEAAMPGEIVTRNMENYNTIIKIIMAYMYTYNMYI